ncbi:uncharacterized protein AMSG_06385 [Thecamonas trahens ATCC 50062]|uniref:F-box/LRR-repeat protein 15-like leucin rich repeat domain-containing protein n=1 Tax=Thecamonas trahens ATCC 50062 TaxID=461836 RepID=A0A0L0DD12_THETB|nr:hypothetical protein AMSG_06385 [Thecamonas trahens ATCC 50062]KNC50232.1 hypothetical protein AMSG_06385 [Thecamonas trahens ATCC 50062]|eukprot:XP_013757063.1 hypothetical protein AMSG_06385 [Thecamonas trahens ATCC 50062]
MACLQDAAMAAIAATFREGGPASRSMATAMAVPGALTADVAARLVEWAAARRVLSLPLLEAVIATALPLQSLVITPHLLDAPLTAASHAATTTWMYSGAPSPNPATAAAPRLADALLSLRSVAHLSLANIDATHGGVGRVLAAILASPAAPGLVSLDISFSDLGPALFHAAAAAAATDTPLTALRSLRLYYCSDLAEDQLAALLKLAPHLVALDLGYSADVSLASLLVSRLERAPDSAIARVVRQLECLSLCGLELTDAINCVCDEPVGDVATIVKLVQRAPALTSLSLGGIRYLDVAGASAIVAATHAPLSSLSLASSFVQLLPDSPLASSSLAHLTALELRAIAWIDDAWLVAWADEMAAAGGCLTTLGLANTSVCSEGVAAIAAVSPRLEKLDLGWSEVDDAALDALAHGCPHLSMLRLRCCEEVTSPALTALVAAAQELVVLDLARMSAVTDEVLASIAPSCTRLDVSWANEVTDVGVAALVQRCQGMRIISLQGCKQVTLAGMGPSLRTGWQDLVALDVSCVPAPADHLLPRDRLRGQSADAHVVG